MSKSIDDVQKMFKKVAFSARKPEWVVVVLGYKGLLSDLDKPSFEFVMLLNPTINPYPFVLT